MRSPTAEWVMARWGRDDGRRLGVPIGLGAEGVVEIDLVTDGPHALLGGTSGAGKSELLRSMVVGLAAGHPPTRLNLLFIDYKGGASSQVFDRLPHAVGCVTDLAADLAGRALTSLRAELRHRMSLLEGRAKDLAEMLESHPDEAPASLVIVVDEFATLVAEAPDFLAGLIDIAQRGRSLGIHLVLATQRPSGSIDDNIVANANIRIALRMVDRAESSAVIDSPDAADFPVPLRGRGLLRLGPRTLVEFQSAYSGAPVVADRSRQPQVVDFERPDDSASAPLACGTGGARQLDVVLDAIAEAAHDLPAPRRPWRDALPQLVTLDELWPAAALDAVRAQPGRVVPVGMLDIPEAQDQRPAIVDLEASGGLLVLGSGGSGKTTLLRSVAVAVDRAAGSGGGAVTFAFDLASRGLSVLRELPSVIDVATGDDLEAVTRHLEVLETELDRRRRLLADAGAEHLAAYVRDHPPLERIVVLVDGIGALVAALAASAGSSLVADTDRWLAALERVVIEGRPLGIHGVLASDRRSAVPARLLATIGKRLILSHADSTSYADLGVAAERAAALTETPGRALLDGTMLVQVAVADRALAARRRAVPAAPTAGGSAAKSSHRLATAALPTVLASDVGSSPARASGSTIGVADVTGDAVVIDVEWSHALVVGAPRSGRSTALAAFVTGWSDPTELFVIGPPASPLRTVRLRRDRCGFGSSDEIGSVLDRLASIAGAARRHQRFVLVVDDLDLLDRPDLAHAWDRVASLDRVRLVAAIEPSAMQGYTANSMLAALRRARRLLVLQPDDPAEFLQLTGVKLPSRPGLRWVPGRGVLLVDRRPTVVQVAWNDPADLDCAGRRRAP